MVDSIGPMRPTICASCALAEDRPGEHYLRCTWRPTEPLPMWWWPLADEPIAGRMRPREESAQIAPRECATRVLTSRANT